MKSWSSIADAEGEVGLFPVAMLKRTGRGYLVNVGIQMNGCFNSGWCDAAAVMLRRLVETVIIEAFEARGLDAKIKNTQDEFFQLTDLINAALQENTWNLTRVTKKALPKLRNVGHLSAHARRYNAHRSDLEHLAPDCRVVLEEFLHLAGLL